MNIMKNLDIFGVPFQFNINGNQKINKTNIGGLIFIIIFILSAMYFGYQNYLFFSDNISSKSTLYINPLKELEQFEIVDELIGFDVVLDRDVKLNEHQKKVGKIFVEFIVSTVFVTDQGLKPIDLKLIECTDTNLKGYMCIDLDKANVPITLEYDPSFSSAWQKSLKIQVVKCENKPECASPQEIDDLLLQVRNQFQVITKLIQYNFKTEKFETTYKLDVYSFDPELSFYSSLNLSKANYNVKKGFLWLNENKISGITSTFKTIQARSQSFMKNKLKMQIYGIVIFYLHNKIEDIEITYPLYTETFAQFVSIFGLLMILGNIGKGFSETKMFDSFVNVFLQEKYKRTLYQQIQKQKYLQSKQNSPSDNQEKEFSSNLQKNLQELQQTNSIQLIRQQNEKKSQKKEIIENFNNNKSNLDQNETRVKMLKEQTDEQICVFDMYRNIVQIQQILKLLLTQEQYSAIKFCGMNLDTILSKKQKIQQKKEKLKKQQITQKIQPSPETPIKSDDEEQQMKKQDSKLQIKSQTTIIQKLPLGRTENRRESNLTSIEDDDSNINHLEKLEIIDIDQEELNENLNKFLSDIIQKKKQQQNIDPISQRIYNCLFIPHKQFES